LKWLRKNGCSWLELSCALAAASGGHVQVLKWMKEVGCPVDPKICTEAMRNGHVEVVLWALQNGCKPDETTTKWLRRFGK